MKKSQWDDPEIAQSRDLYEEPPGEIQKGVKNPLLNQGKKKNQGNRLGRSKIKEEGQRGSKGIQGPQPPLYFGKCKRVERGEKGSLAGGVGGGKAFDGMRACLCQINRGGAGREAVWVNFEESAKETCKPPDRGGGGNTPER